MTVSTIFDVASQAMAAQMVRLNAVTSNIAQVGAVSGTEEGAYRAIRPVFGAVYSENFARDGLSSVQAQGVVALDREPQRMFQPDHPNADAEGFVWQSAVDPDEELVEMMEASRQYQNTLETVSTLRTLMARTISMGQ